MASPGESGYMGQLEKTGSKVREPGARPIKAIGVPTWTGGGLIPADDAKFYSDNELALHPRGRNVGGGARIFVQFTLRLDSIGFALNLFRMSPSWRHAARSAGASRLNET